MKAREKNKQKQSNAMVLAYHDIVPPQAIDIENSIIGQLITNSNSFLEISDLLKPEMFYKEVNNIIFGALRNMFDDKKHIDSLTIVEYLRKTNELEQVGGITTIINYTKNILSSQGIREYALIILEKYIQRQLIMTSSLRVNNLYNDDCDFKEEIDSIQQELNDINNILLGINTKKKTFTELLSLNLKKYYTKKNTEITNEYEANIIELDRNLMIERGDLVIIGARPAMGKTSFALQLTRNWCRVGKKGLFLSLEMTEDKLISRILIAESGIDNARFRYGKLYPDEETKLNEATNKLDKWNLNIEDKKLTSQNIESLINLYNPDFVLIDYLGLIVLDKKDSRNNELGDVTRSLKFNAKKYNIPILALHQLSREVEKRGNKRPILSDLRDSGEIEQDADIIIFLYRDAYYTKDKTNLNIEIDIAKYREGSTGYIELTTDYQISNFKSLNSF